MREEYKTEWDKEIEKTIALSLKRLEGKIQRAEAKLRSNSDFLELEQARKKYAQRNPWNKNSMGYAIGYVHHRKKLRIAKVREFTRNYKPILLFQDEWQSDPNNLREWFKLDLVEYQKLNGESSGIYGAIQEQFILGTWMKDLDLFRFKRGHDLEDLKRIARKAKDEKSIMAIGPVHTYSKETKILSYLESYRWDDRKLSESKNDALWEKLLP